jgi:hypothetical protein
MSNYDRILTEHAERIAIARHVLCPIARPECERPTAYGRSRYEELIEVDGVDPDVVRLDDGGWWWRAEECPTCREIVEREERLMKEED